MFVWGWLGCLCWVSCWVIWLGVVSGLLGWFVGVLQPFGGLFSVSKELVGSCWL